MALVLTLLAALLGTAVPAGAASAVVPGAVAPDAATPGVAGTRTRDFTLDKREDLLTRTPAGQLTLYPGSGTAGTTAFGGAVTINSGWAGASWIGAADVTGDGKPDVLAQNGDRISVFPHAGRYDQGAPLATLGKPQAFGGAGWGGVSLKVLQDFTGDGVADLLGRGRDGALYLWPVSAGNGRVTVGKAEQVLPDFRGYDQFDAADINGDGAVDLIVRQGGDLYALPGQPIRHGRAAPPGFVKISGNWDQSRLTTTKDVNGDGKPDLVSQLRSNGELLVFLNTGGHGRISFGGRTSLGTRWARDTQLN